MPNTNIVVLAGFLSRDPETRYTPKGTCVVNLGLAVNRTWRNDAGEKQEEVSFFDCVAFGKTAETIGQYFKKGGAILVQGRLKQESWEDKQSGQKRYAVKVIVESFNFVGDSKGGGDGATADRTQADFKANTRPARTPAPVEPGPEQEADDVPF